MTKTQTILKILADGKLRSADELADLTGLGRVGVVRVLKDLKNHGFIQTDPVRFTVTPKGEERSKWRPLTKEEHRLRNIARIQESRRLKKAPQSQAITRQALASRGALESMWGARP